MKTAIPIAGPANVANSTIRNDFAAITRYPTDTTLLANDTPLDIRLHLNERNTTLIGSN